MLSLANALSSFFANFCGSSCTAPRKAVESLTPPGKKLGVIAFARAFINSLRGYKGAL